MCWSYQFGITFEEYEEDPELVFNIDEMPLEPGTEKQQYVSLPFPSKETTPLLERRHHISEVSAFSACGAPLMVIFAKLGTIDPELISAFPNVTFSAKQEGFMNTELFLL